MTEKRQTSQGYIIRILQHFATKLPNITNFVMLFQAVMKFLSRSKFCSLGRRVKIEKINNLFQVDINRREQGCAAHYEQYCQHVVTVLFNCNNLEQHG